MELSLSKLVDYIESLTITVGRLASWVYPLLVFVVCINVIMRYGFSIGMIEMEEVQWHLYSIGFLLAIAWTYAEDEHVRVDLIHHNLNKRAKAYIEFFGCLFLLLPFSAFLTYYSYDFVLYSWQLKEGSDNPSGLPARYIIKGCITLGVGLMTLQSIATLTRSFLILKFNNTEER